LILNFVIIYANFWAWSNRVVCTGARITFRVSASIVIAARDRVSVIIVEALITVR